MRLRHAALALLGLYPLAVKEVFAQAQQPSIGGSYVPGNVPYGCYITQGTSIVYVPCTTSGANFIPSPTSSGGSIGAVTQSGVWTVYTTPTSGAFTSPGAIVGTGVAVALAGGSYNHVQLQNLSSGATIGCSWATSGSLTSASGFQLAPGQSALWGPTTAGVPSGSLLCVASATGVPLYIEKS
jgi:hypothetical protein